MSLDIDAHLGWGVLLAAKPHGWPEDARDSRRWKLQQLGYCEAAKGWMLVLAETHAQCSAREIYTFEPDVVDPAWQAELNALLTQLGLPQQEGSFLLGVYVH